MVKGRHSTKCRFCFVKMFFIFAIGLCKSRPDQFLVFRIQLAQLRLRFFICVHNFIWKPPLRNTIFTAHSNFSHFLKTKLYAKNAKADASHSKNPGKNQSSRGRIILD